MPSLAQLADSDARPAVRFGVGDCAHRMHVVGRMHGRPDGRVDCDQPLRAVCRECGHVEPWRCDSYGCAPCGEAKRRRLARLVDNGAGIHLGNGMVGYFLTLTAPGTKAGHRRWVQGKQRGVRRVVCGCEDHGLSDGMWNAGESANWNRLRTSLARGRQVIFVGAVETQKRQMLHRHVMLFSSEVLTYEEVQAQALAAGYGCVLDLEVVRSSEKAARYISKYVTKASGDRAVVPWERLDLATGELTGRRATYRLWSSSRKWGVTMKEIRQVQAAQARARALYLDELAALLADDIAAAGAPGPASGGDSDPP